MNKTLSSMLLTFVAAALPACAQESKPQGKQEPAKAAPAKQETAKPAAGKDLAAKDPVIVAIDEACKKVDTKAKDWRTTLSAPSKQTFTAGTDYYWNLKTNKGDIKVHLFADSAPMHVTSTIFLTRLGFYDGLSFHRVIPGFMAQGGCPLGNGTGGPGYKYAGEFGGTRKHDKPGILSMANAGPGTDGSQFFLTFVSTPHLDGKHTIFGEVVEGLDTLKSLEAAGSQSGKTSKPLSIISATISVEAKGVSVDAGKKEEPKKDVGK
jgi:peptidyl-prolyl cis-trans isomerase B (cyclophilin B)